GNWSAGGAPTSGETNVQLTFASGATILTGLNNDVSNLSVTSITFQTSGYSITTGNSITLASGNGVATNNPSGTNEFDLPIAMSGTPTFNIATGGTLLLKGVLSGSGGLTLSTGQGTLVLSGTNTYTGTTTVAAGTLVAGTNAPSGSAGALGNATSSVLVGDTSG